MLSLQRYYTKPAFQRILLPLVFPSTDFWPLGTFAVARFISWCLPARAVSLSIYKWSKVVYNVCPPPVPGVTGSCAVSSTRMEVASVSPGSLCHECESLSPIVRRVSVRMTDKFLCTSCSWNDGFWWQCHVVTSEETKKKKVNTARQPTTACVNIPIVRSLGRCAFLSDLIFLFFHWESLITRAFGCCSLIMANLVLHWMPGTVQTIIKLRSRTVLDFLEIYPAQLMQRIRVVFSILVLILKSQWIVSPFNTLCRKLGETI